jgi:hypothetical protein
VGGLPLFSPPQKRCFSFAVLRFALLCFAFLRAADPASKPSLLRLHHNPLPIRHSRAADTRASGEAASGDKDPPGRARIPRHPRRVWRPLAGGRAVEASDGAVSDQRSQVGGHPAAVSSAYPLGTFGVVGPGIVTCEARHGWGKIRKAFGERGPRHHAGVRSRQLPALGAAAPADAAPGAAPLGPYQARPPAGPLLLHLWLPPRPRARRRRRGAPRAVTPRPLASAAQARGRALAPRPGWSSLGRGRPCRRPSRRPRQAASQSPLPFSTKTRRPVQAASPARHTETAPRNAPLPRANPSPPPLPPPRNYVLQGDPVPRAFLSADPAFQLLSGLPAFRALLELRAALAGGGRGPLSPGRFLFESVGEVHLIKWSPDGGRPRVAARACASRCALRAPGRKTALPLSPPSLAAAQSNKPGPRPSKPEQLIINVATKVLT